jgi:sporulation protein YlmC with PRC-barrel domain
VVGNLDSPTKSERRATRSEPEVALMSRRSDVVFPAGEDADPGRRIRLELGAPIGCRDGELGELADVVLAPDSGRVTDLVVEPRHHDLEGPRLVPIALFEPRGQRAGLMLQCTLREFDAMEQVRQVGSMLQGQPRADDPNWDVGKIDSVPAVPMPIEGGEASYLLESTVTYDRVPKYEIELGRTSPVESSDGHRLGHVVALTVDRKGVLSSVVLERRHLWRREHLEVPIDAVDEMGTDLVTLSLTRREAAELPTERASGR